MPYQVGVSDLVNELRSFCHARLPHAGKTAGRHRLMKLLLALALPVTVIGDIQSTTQTLSVNVAAYGKLSLPSNVNLRAMDTRFGGALSGTPTVSYWARTSGGGSNSVTVQASSEFAPAQDERRST